jgi:hypothetical protein
VNKDKKKLAEKFAKNQEQRVHDIERKEKAKLREV